MPSKFLNISVDNTLGGASPSDQTVSSQKAIKDYVDGKVPTSNDYWTVGNSNDTSVQKTYSRKILTYKATNDQDNGFKLLGTEWVPSGSYSEYWLGRMLLGTDKHTFLLGTVINGQGNYMCGIGAHSWTDAEAQTGAAWEDVYIQPDGNKAVYLGGRQWRTDSGWFKVQNNADGSSAYRTYINTGTNTSPTWRTVLPNQASGTNSVLIRPNTSSTFSYTYATSINGTITANYGSSFGYNATAGSYGVAMGYDSAASGSYSIQIGRGTNSTANTMSVGLSNSLNVQLLDSSGEIPDARIKTTIARVSQIPTTASDIGAQPSGNYVTTDTTQDITATKTFKAPQKFQSGDAAGCLTIGADVSATTVSSNTRKLGRMCFYTNEDPSLKCSFVSTDSQDVGGNVTNFVEFGGRSGDQLNTSPDTIQFTVANSHNSTTSKTTVAEYTSSGSRFNSNNLAVITANRTSNSGGSFIKYARKGTSLGHLGIAGTGVPAFSDASATNNNVLVRCGSTTAPAVGSATKPVYIDSNGIAQECSNSIPTTASDVGALPDSTKYGADLSYSSDTLQLLDQDGNALGNPVTISGGGSSTLSGLTDVTITSATSGQALLYDGSKWVNGSAGVSATYDAVNERITFA